MFKAPAEGGECGTCQQVLPGPIHSKEYCIAWASPRADHPFVAFLVVVRPRLMA
ncbi:hypothetical protein [Nitrosomonas communis]|uniref:hypothetical protein n=1 Tax=Nitrosomonas communis TaxID=44574 RepID=UPI001160C949